MKIGASLYGLNNSRFPFSNEQIASPECCKSLPHNGTESRHVRALGVIVMELMQGYAKEDGAVGIDDLFRWPSDSIAVNFLSTTVTASSVGALTKHPLLCLPWQKEMLIGLVSFVSVDTNIGRRLSPR